MSNSNPGEKYEIIEQALQEAVGGGAATPVCGWTCHLASRDLCNIDICSFSPTKATA
jgi:hypothetical protein